VASTKVFISSTCYDLGIIRAQLRSFVLGFGHEPVMSDYSDVLYDPKVHTHFSCVQEVQNCDVLLLIIGSRYGGTALPTAVDLVDIDSLRAFSSSTELLDKKEYISITQLEVLKAIESKIPIYTFVDTKVLHDHLVYEKNKGKTILEEIDFPSIEDKNTAKYIFEFINFLRHRTENNSISGFAKMDDIESHLRKQWSGLFQLLLFERRLGVQEETKMDYLAEQIADIKTALITSLSSSELQETAKGAIKYRMLIQFLCQFRRNDHRELILSLLSWEDLLKELNIKGIYAMEESSNMYRGRGAVIVLNDGTYYETRIGLSTIDRYSIHWSEFINLTMQSREAIFHAVIDSEDTGRMSGPSQIRYINSLFTGENINVEREPIIINSMNAG